MDFNEAGGLGLPYHTSKRDSTSLIHGTHGTFLSSLAALSLLTISSHHHEHHSTSTLTLHHSGVVARLVPAPADHQLANREHGTRVTVHDLFGNMPVRVKQRALGTSYTKGDKKPWRLLCKEVVALHLAWGCPVTLSMRGAGETQRLQLRGKAMSEPQHKRHRPDSSLFSLSLTRSILSQAGFISPLEWDTWIKVSAHTPKISIQAGISLQPAPTKSVQFMSLGILPINGESITNVLFEEVNRLFDLSSFGNQDDIPNSKELIAKRAEDKRFKQDGFTHQQLKSGGKGVDRWPMFYINITLNDNLGPSNLGDILENESSHLPNITKVLAAMILRFLKDHHFRPQARKRSGACKTSQDLERRMPTDQTSIHHFGKGWKITKDGLKTSSSTKDTGFLTDDAMNPRRLSRIINSKSISITGNGMLVEFPPVEKTKPLSTTDADLAEDIAAGEDNQNAYIDSIILYTDSSTKQKFAINARTGNAILERPTETSPNGTPASGLQLRCQKMPRLTRKLSGSGMLRTPAGSWVTDVLKQWKNPIFEQPEAAIPTVSFESPSSETSISLRGQQHCCSDTQIQRVFSEASSRISTKLSKASLQNSKIISQVDRKFILVLAHASDSSQQRMQDQSSSFQMLVLIDQHAADERIRVEELLADLYRPISPTTTPLSKALIFQVSTNDLRLFILHKSRFARWAVHYETTDLPDPRITVKALPEAIAARCSADPKTLINLLRTEIWRQNDSPISTASSSKTPESASGKCPDGILDLINSERDHVQRRADERGVRDFGTTISNV